MYTRIFTFAIALLTLASLSAESRAQSDQDHYDAQVDFLLSFTNYMHWEASSYRKGDFVVGVLGRSPIYFALADEAKTRKVGRQNVSVKRFNFVHDIAKCHMLYIPASEAEQLPAVLKATEGTSIVLVTEAPGMAREGSCINFVKRTGEVQFEINRSQLKSRKVAVLDELVRMATPIE